MRRCRATLSGGHGRWARMASSQVNLFLTRSTGHGRADRTAARSAGGEFACLVSEEGAFDEGADGGLFVGVELGDGFEVVAEFSGMLGLLQLRLTVVETDHAA